MNATLPHVDKAIYAVARLSRRAWDARMESAAHHRPSAHHGDGFVGVIYGDIGTTVFRCSVAEAVERNEFVQVQHETCGTVLGRVDEIERKTDLSWTELNYSETAIRLTWRSECPPKSV